MEVREWVTKLPFGSLLLELLGKHEDEQSALTENWKADGGDSISRTGNGVAREAGESLPAVSVETHALDEVLVGGEGRIFIDITV